jgi:hypothetical protein
MYRAFLGLGEGRQHDTPLEGTSVKVDDVSVLSSCVMGRGSVTSSALTNVMAETVDCEGAVLVNVTAKSIKAARGAIIYNVVSDSEVS